MRSRFALINVRLDRRKLGLTQDERHKIVEDTIAELRRHQRWQELDDIVEPPLGHP